MVDGRKAGMTGQAGRGRWMGVLLIAGALLALASAPAALGADRIYWGNGTTGTISYANLDGSGGGGELNLSGATPNEPRGVVIDSAAGRIYWANQGNNTISYANLDGSGGGGQLNISGTTPSKPHGLAIDPAAGRIYWANDNNTISYANLDGSGGGPIDISGATPAAPYGAAIDPAAGRIYWANRSSSTISYANLDGSGGGGELDLSGATPNDPHGVVIDPAGGRIYWANLDSRISYANLDGSGGGGELNLPAGLERGGVGLAIDPTAGRIYWGNLGSWEISYANLDGSGGDNLNHDGANPNTPRFVALLRAPSAAGAPQIAGGSTPGSVLTCSQGAWAPDVLGSFFYRAPQSIAYEWTRGGSKIAGATGGTFTAKKRGSYACSVTATNQAGSTAQTSARLKVRDPRCKKLRGKLKRQEKKPATAKIKDTKKRLKKLGC
jgi:DNA-binding beta-propeller fold protein YncE